MSDADLCKAVAVKALGWKHYPPGDYGNRTTYVDMYAPYPVSNVNALECNGGLQLNWSDAGRVVEAMREKGWRFVAEQREDGLWVVSFRRGRGVDTLAYQHCSKSFPLSVFTSAHEAVRGGV